MSMITILHELHETQVPQGALQGQTPGEALWLDRAAIEMCTGWAWKPEGLCQADTCIPLPKAANALVRDDQLDIAQMWRHMGNPVVHDQAMSTWVLGTGSAQRMNTLGTLEAPDFTLPDLDGKKHRLSDYRGQKVFLATWASW
jgi:AhpC/TSA family